MYKNLIQFSQIPRLYVCIPCMYVCMHVCVCVYVCVCEKVHPCKCKCIIISNCFIADYIVFHTLLHIEIILIMIHSYTLEILINDIFIADLE